MFEAVVVSLDGSGTAEQALPYAALLSRCEGAPLHMVRVVSPYPLTGLHEALNDLQRVAAPWAARTTVRTGSPAEEILALADELPNPVIVIAAHGHGRARRPLGHVVTRVVHGASMPVLIVRTDTPGVPAPSVDPLLVPLEDGASPDAAVLSLAAHLARRCDAALCLVPLVDRTGLYHALVGDPALGGVGPAIEVWEALNVSAEQAAERCRRAAEPLLHVAGVLARTRVLPAMSIDELLAHTRATPPGLVVLGTHGRGRLNRLFAGSVAEQMLSRGTAPTLVVRPQHRASVPAKAAPASTWLRPAAGRASS